MALFPTKVQHASTGPLHPAAIEVAAAGLDVSAGLLCYGKQFFVWRRSVIIVADTDSLG